MEDKTTTVYMGDNITPVDKLFTLPRDAIEGNAAPCEENTFDVYTDTSGGIYWYYSGTDVLHSYEPYTEDVKLGNTVVDTIQAMGLVNNFLETTGYNVSDWRMKISNCYSKDYKIEFQEGRKKLVFHIQATESGSVRLNNFSAYVGNYGS